MSGFHVIFGSDIGFPYQNIILIDADFKSNEPLGTNSYVNLIKMQQCSFMKFRSWYVETK